ncbi:unnamed protein product [Prorocentrum cordatum]|uniref:Uncharacterized protein n=1 Tax=Prorocentrum cordatum TaxID=2364126 RepID=A0ABN9RW58_9DINO|nr:unnamed protein product [Polarella glacialis]
MSMMTVRTFSLMVQFPLEGCVVMRSLFWALEYHLMVPIFSVKCFLMVWMLVGCCLELRIFLVRCSLEGCMEMLIFLVKGFLEEWSYLVVRSFSERYSLEGFMVVLILWEKCFRWEWSYMVMRIFSVTCFLMEVMLVGCYLEVRIFLAKCSLEGFMVVRIFLVKGFLKELRVVECLLAVRISMEMCQLAPLTLQVETLRLYLRSFSSPWRTRKRTSRIRSSCVSVRRCCPLVLAQPPRGLYVRLYGMGRSS